MRQLNRLFVLSAATAFVACGASSSPSDVPPDAGPIGASVDAGSDAQCELPCAGDVGTGGDANPPVPDAKYAFVTSKSFGSNLGGLDAADAKCQELAAAARRPLPGTYRAWLSTGTSSGEGAVQSAGTPGDPEHRLTHSAAPYIRTDGTAIARNWDDLLDGNLDAPIDWDENGSHLEAQSNLTSLVWTNTTPDGRSAGNNDCGGWQTDGAGIVDFGTFTSKSLSWTYYTFANTCNFQARLYCFQQ